MGTGHPHAHPLWLLFLPVMYLACQSLRLSAPLKYLALNDTHSWSELTLRCKAALVCKSGEWCTMTLYMWSKLLYLHSRIMNKIYLFLDFQFCCHQQNPFYTDFKIIKYFLLTAILCQIFTLSLQSPIYC